MTKKLTHIFFANVVTCGCHGNGKYTQQKMTYKISGFQGAWLLINSSGATRTILSRGGAQKAAF